MYAHYCALYLMKTQLRRFQFYPFRRHTDVTRGHLRAILSDSLRQDPIYRKFYGHHRYIQLIILYPPLQKWYWITRVVFPFHRLLFCIFIRNMYFISFTTFYSAFLNNFMLKTVKLLKRHKPKSSRHTIDLLSSIYKWVFIQCLYREFPFSLVSTELKRSNSSILQLLVQKM